MVRMSSDGIDEVGIYNKGRDFPFLSTQMFNYYFYGTDTYDFDNPHRTPIFAKVLINFVSLKKDFFRLEKQVGLDLEEETESLTKQTSYEMKGCYKFEP